MLKRILSLVLLMTTGLALCACPGGGPVTPPANPCPTCGKDPCECGTKTPCPTCGKNPCECEAEPPCSTCGKSPCECPPPPAHVDFGEGTLLPGAGDTLAADAPVLTEKPYSESGAIAKPAARFFAQVGFDGKTYKASGTTPAPLKDESDETFGHASKVTVLFLPNGMTVTGCENVVLRNLVIVGDVTVASGTGIIFENVQFNGKLTVSEDAEGTVLNGCRFASLANEGKDTYVISSYVPFTGTGIVGGGAGLFVQNCRFEGTGTAISVTGDDLEVRSSTVKTDKDGIGVEVKDAQNALVALCVIRGTQKSVALDGVHNTAVVRNTVISVQAAASTNLYVIDNEMGGRVESENVNYFIADGNTYPADGLDHRAVQKNNENVNGTELTDEKARPAVGANEALLPHINKDQFIGMARKSAVKEYGAAKAATLYSYLMAHAKTDDIVIVAPGAYAVEETGSFNAAHNNTTVYAYGVLAEGIAYKNQSYALGHIRISGVDTLSIKGLFTGYAQPTCGQVYILKKLDGNKLLAVTGAGFWNDFGNSDSTKAFMDATSTSILRAGTEHVFGEYFITSVEKKSDGTMIITVPSTTYEVTKKGDIYTCRIKGGSVVVTSSSKNIVYKDVTQYGYSGGFAFTESGNLNSTLYYRVTDTSKGSMEISADTYEKYSILQEEYGVDLEVYYEELEGGKIRYRGSPAHISSIDGVHNDRSVEGSTVICCLFENMCDDGTNQKSMHARLSEVNDLGNGRIQIVYKGNLSNHVYSTKKQDSTFTLFCSRFEKGDRVYIYTSGGQLVCDTPALTDAVATTSIMSNCPGVTPKEIQRYAVEVDAAAVNLKALEGYNLNDDSYLPDEKVVVDNMSRGSYGFHYDNTLIQNLRSNGMRVKASGGLIENCTFRNIAKCAILMAFEIWWGESSVAENTTIKNNLIDHTSYSNDAPALDNPSDSYRSTPISVMGLGGKTMDADHLLYKNIVIEGNKFVNRCLDNYNYAIFARSACGMTIKNNDFGSASDEDGLEKYATVIYLNSTVDVELSGNTYSPYVPSPADLVHGDRYRNVFGSDVGNAVPDKE